MDSRATGSALFGSARSLCNASQRAEDPPADPPVPPMRVVSIFHSVAFERTNWSARAASAIDHDTGGVTPRSCASVTKR